LGLALLSATIGTYSFAAGLAIWPAGFVVLALLDGQRRGKATALALWGAWGVAATALYLWGFVVPDDANGPGASWSGLISAVAYVCAFVGGGLWNGHTAVALGLGVFGVIAAVVC